MNHDLLGKMKVKELKSYLKIRDLNETGTKKELVARGFAASENGVQLVKPPVEVKS